MASPRSSLVSPYCPLGRQEGPGKGGREQKALSAQGLALLTAVGNV